MDCIKNTFTKVVNYAQTSNPVQRLQDVAIEVKNTAHCVALLAYAIIPFTTDCDPLGVFQDSSTNTNNSNNDEVQL